MDPFSLVFLAGFLIGGAVMTAGLMWMFKRAKEGKPLSPKTINRATLVAALVVMSGFAMMFGQSSYIVHADDTPVPLVIPINAIFSQANNWLQTLSPIESLGIGIIIALAVFGFLAKAIKSGFG